MQRSADTTGDGGYDLLSRPTCATTEEVLQRRSSAGPGGQTLRLPLVLGVCASVLLHGLVLAWLAGQSHCAPAPAGSLMINLAQAPQPRNPSAGTVSAPVAREPARQPEEPVATVPQVGPSEVPPPQPTPVSPRDFPVPLPTTPVPIVAEPMPAQPGYSPPLPTAMSLRQAVREVTTASGVDAIMQDCNLLQSRSDLVFCTPDNSPLMDPDRVGRQAIPFTAGSAVTRGRTVAATLADNRAQLRAGLTAADLDESARRFLTEQLEAGIEVYTGTGNMPLRRLQEQIYRNDAAYQQAQRVLNPR